LYASSAVGQGVNEERLGLAGAPSRLPCVPGEPRQVCQLRGVKGKLPHLAATNTIATSRTLGASNSGRAIRCHAPATAHRLRPPRPAKDRSLTRGWGERNRLGGLGGGLRGYARIHLSTFPALASCGILAASSHDQSRIPTSATVSPGTAPVSEDPRALSRRQREIARASPPGRFHLATPCSSSPSPR
jgi:hypothetical protein